MKKTLIPILVILIFIIGCSGENDQKESANRDLLFGEWTGAIEIPNQPLNISVEFENEGELKGTISIPIQGVQNYPLSSIKLEGENDILFTMKIQGQLITFDGEVDDETILGTFKQNGQSFPFQLTKGEGVATEEDDGDFLHIETDQGTLYGELETPTGEGPFPVMIIIPGSGPTDRDGNSPALPGKNDSLKLLAEELAEQGIASIRYDKRGAGKNQQALVPEEDMHFDQFVDDTIAWVDLAVEDENYTKVGVIGHSQGSLVGMLAAQESNVDTFISLAGAGRSIDEVLYDQLKDQLPEDLMKESEELLQQLKAGKQVEDVSQELQSVFRPSVQAFTSSWMQYDPAVEIEKLDIPTLIINGENDLQVSAKEAEILHEAKADAEILLIEKMNHVLKEAPEDREGNMQTYGNPDLPLADGLMEAIVEFLEKTGDLK